ALGHRPHHADPGRPGAALRRLHRRHRVHDPRGPAGQGQPGAVGVRGRRRPGAGSAVLPPRAARRAGGGDGADRDAAGMRPRLQVTGLSRHFDGLYVTRNVSLDLDEGARHALIGPNGAGKTTLVNLISGALAPDAGRIVLDGDDVTGLDQAARVKRGLVRTFQINQLFPRLPVLDNVALAVAERRGESRRLLAAPRRGRET